MGRILEMASPVRLAASAAVGGYEERRGPYGEALDFCSPDDRFGAESFELAEAEMARMALFYALGKAGLTAEALDLVLSGDLQNQCVASSQGAGSLGAPFLGLFGACSTMVEGLGIGGLLLCGCPALTHVGVVTSSHNAAAERQFRTPLEYGAQRPPTAQWTATASGCTILAADGPGPYITHVTCGKIVDRGIKDANNMGAAMAPAAYDTLSAHFRETGRKPTDYDLILTGDLGELGREIVIDFFARDGIDMRHNYNDCGLMLYDLKKQDMHAGASGCGCSAAVLNGYLLRQMRQKKLNNILFAPTGALLSPTSSFQGESIPSICHAVAFSNQKEGAN